MNAAEAAENLELTRKGRPVLHRGGRSPGEKDERFLRSAARFLESRRRRLSTRPSGAGRNAGLLLPADEEPRKKVNDLTAKATIKRSGMQDRIDQHTKAGSSGPEKDLPPDAEELRRLAITPEQRYLKEMEETPERIGPYLALAEHYKMEGRLKEAEDVLAKGVKAGEPGRQLPAGSVRRRPDGPAPARRSTRSPARWGQGAARPRAQDQGSSSSRWPCTSTSSRSCDVNWPVSRPKTLKLRLLLGRKLAEGGASTTRPSPEFQRVRNSPELKVQALLQAGLSFKANGVDQARRTQLRGRQCRPWYMKDTATLNELHYNLGILAAEEQGNLAIAEEHLQRGRRQRLLSVPGRRPAAQEAR